MFVPQQGGDAVKDSKIGCPICSINYLALLFKDPTPAHPSRGGDMRTANLVVSYTYGRTN